MVEKVRLEDLPSGELFLYEGTIALKSEYGMDYGACACYIVGSGELFWGGVETSREINDLLVTPISIKEYM